LIRPPASHILPIEYNRALLRRERAGDHVEQRGLAGAVRTDQARDGAAPHLQRGAIDSLHAAKTAMLVLDGQDRL